ncbi:hypothetical protein R3W88_008010 [Solanum pinnatisectum]|uniref:Uncharacterized protein n=1 Tax=Solanum pinnatisectum TaxID=50273 RepID=A0AAV9M7C5_9SOLN|nr:hypothetical protein R3W88_008010 [Solanum pinnatisectum]
MKVSKNIKLKGIMLSNDHIVNLLLGCPALETMELSCFKHFSQIDHSLEIVSPYLHHLETSGSLHGLKCRLIDISSMVNTKLTFEITCIKDM